MASSLRISHVFTVAAVVLSVAAPVPMYCESDDDDSKEFCTDLMQPQRSLLHRSAGAEVVALPDPVTWLHVPRTGESFLYTLISSEAICPGFAGTASFELRAVTTNNVANACPGIYQDEGCIEHQPDQAYGQCAEMAIGGADRYAGAEGKIVSMFRQPEVRLLSDYHYADGGHISVDFATYANSHLGCFTKKITFSGMDEVDGHCGGAPPTWDQVALAEQRVQTDFVFIGMTDEWNLSMCLFNAMFGSQCRAIQFQSYGDHTTDSNSSDLSEIGGFVDVYDRGVWQMARRIYKGNLRRFNVAEETCQPCSD